MTHHQSDVLSRYQDQQYDEQQYDEEAEKGTVRNRPIQWEQFSGTHSDAKETAKMVQFDKKQADKIHLFEENGVIYAKIFMVYLFKLSNPDDIRYVLTLLDDFLLEAQRSKNFNTILSHFFNLHKYFKDPTLTAPPFGPILSLLNRKLDDPYILSLGSRVLTTLILHHPHITPELIESNAWQLLVDELLKSSPKNAYYERKISIALVSLRALFSVDAYRRYFVFNSEYDRLQVLLNFIAYEDRREEISVVTSKSKKKGVEESIQTPQGKKASNFQLIYEAVYCLWCLSFNEDVKQKLVDPKLINNLCHIVKRCTNKVKVVRISLATLRNLLGVGRNNELMYSYGLLTSLNLLKQRRWADEELENDLKEIEISLERNVADLTSWDRYKNEVMALRLEWSPAHKSNKFWQENYLKFEDDNFLVLHTLKTILMESKDPQVLAIACWDIGEFVRVHPQGKRICDRLQLKIPIMRLLTSDGGGESQAEEPQMVTKEALTALQKLMITNWEYLQ